MLLIDYYALFRSIKELIFILNYGNWNPVLVVDNDYFDSVVEYVQDANVVIKNIFCNLSSIFKNIY